MLTLCVENVYCLVRGLLDARCYNEARLKCPKSDRESVGAVGIEMPTGGWCYRAIF